MKIHNVCFENQKVSEKKMFFPVILPTISDNNQTPIFKLKGEMNSPMFQMPSNKGNFVPSRKGHFVPFNCIRTGLTPEPPIEQPVHLAVKKSIMKYPIKSQLDANKVFKNPQQPMESSNLLQMTKQTNKPTYRLNKSIKQPETSPNQSSQGILHKHSNNRKLSNKAKVETDGIQNLDNVQQYQQSINDLIAQYNEVNQAHRQVVTRKDRKFAECRMLPSKKQTLKKCVRRKKPSHNNRDVLQEFSEFDLRKCHSPHVVSKEHGYLTDYNIEDLIKKTGYSRGELYALWATFKALCSLARCPKGIDKEAFRRGVPLLSVEDSLFVDRVFDILDGDKSGRIDWEEFIHAMSCLEKGTPVQRLLFLFKVYDLNNDQRISKEELAKFFLSSLMVWPTKDIAEVSRSFVDKIFLIIDPIEKDSIKVRDVVQYIKDHDVHDIYSLFGRTMVNSTTYGEESNILNEL